MIFVWILFNTSSLHLSSKLTRPEIISGNVQMVEGRPPKTGHVKIVLKYSPRESGE